MAKTAIGFSRWWHSDRPPSAKSVQSSDLAGTLVNAAHSGVSRNDDQLAAWRMLARGKILRISVSVVVIAGIIDQTLAIPI